MEEELKCSIKHPEIIEKVKQTKLEKYGDPNYTLGMHNCCNTL